jgi:hypothetical protein
MQEFTFQTLNKHGFEWDDLKRKENGAEGEV